MKKLLLASSIAACFVSGAAMAEDAASPLSFNVGAVTDYRYRGVSQSRLDPAFQVGADYAAANGFYIGTWASTIKWVKDAGGGASTEVDVYGGYKGEITKDLTYDVGVLGYLYSSNRLTPSANTTELYGALSYGPVTAKYSDSVTNLFGFANSKNSGYLDITGTFELAKTWSAIAHIGHQTVKGTYVISPSYTDYKLGVTKDYDGLVLGASLIGTDNSKAYLSPAPALKNLGKSALVLSLVKTF